MFLPQNYALCTESTYSISPALSPSQTDCTHVNISANVVSATLTILSVTEFNNLKTTWLLTSEVTIMALFVKKINFISFTITTRDIAAEHYWEDAQTHRGNVNLSLSLSLITVINCISLLSTALALKWRFGISNGWDAEEIILLTIAI